MKRGPTGRYLTDRRTEEPYKIFLPNPLPPKPPLQIDASLREDYDTALLSLGRLDSVTTILPDTDIFLYMYVRKEAVLSSQIEGTQSSLSDLLLFELEEAPGVPLDDVVEVSNYVAALAHGLKRLNEGFPLSNRLIREVHGVLLAKGRGSDKEPGEFRRSQNWIGGSRPGNALFVPPPPERLDEAMAMLEKFLHDIPERTAALLKCALAHVQFETIHPFLDGNGRIGRLLIALLLAEEKVLHRPLLYLSLYFKQHRKRYYDLLQKVRLEGDWEEWLHFFFTGIREISEGAVMTVRKLSEIADSDRRKIEGLGRVSGSALRVQRVLQKRPLGSIPFLRKETGLSAPAVTKAVLALRDAGIIEEITGKKRNRLFCYEEYLAVLNKGTEV
jgi:Fic family protein